MSDRIMELTRAPKTTIARGCSICKPSPMAKASGSISANADTGKILATYPIGDHVDASAFDPGTKLVFNSLGEDSITVFRQDLADKYTAPANIPTAQRSKTMTLDAKTHRLYVPSMRPGQFTILVLEREAK